MKKILMTIIAAAVAIPTFAQTAPSRVAVFRPERLINDSVAGKAASEKLKKIADDRSAKGKKMQEELQALETQLQSKSLTDARLAELQKDYDDKKLALTRFAQDAQRDLDQANEAAMGELEKQVAPIVAAVGKDMGLAAIFSRQQSGIFWASDAIDITDVLIKRFDDSVKGTAPAKP